MLTKCSTNIIVYNKHNIKLSGSIRMQRNLVAMNLIYLDKTGIYDQKEGSQGLISRIGVSFRTSRQETLIESVVTSSTVTSCSPIGFGRSGDRVEKTPTSGLSKSFRVTHLTMLRSPRSSHVSTTIRSPFLMFLIAS